MDKKEFAEFVSKARIKSALTLHEFSKEIGTSWVTVWRWENEHNVPRPEAIEYWVRKINEV